MIYCDILIIDDDPDDLEILTEALNKSGVEKVHYVYSAKEAFRYLEEVYPECIPKVIVTDFLLPLMTGYEFLADLKAMDKYKEVKVVVLSSAKSQQQIEKLRELGDYDFYEKPSSFDRYMEVAESIKSKIVS
jgi:CheY-like chemotaxis protein